MDEGLEIATILRIINIGVGEYGYRPPITGVKILLVSLIRNTSHNKMYIISYIEFAKKF